VRAREITDLGLGLLNPVFAEAGQAKRQRRAQPFWFNRLCDREQRDLGRISSGANTCPL